MGLKRIKFKGIVLTRTKTVNNILKAYRASDEEDRTDWYKEANQFAKEVATHIHDLRCLSKACGILAATSPMKHWKSNKACALSFVQGTGSKHMGSVERKCERISASNGGVSEIMEILNGNKTVAFFMNIRFPEKYTHLTIDRHAISVALGVWVTDEKMKLTNAQYEFFVQCYVTAAWKCRVSPLLMQSATWSWFRKNKTDFKRW